MHRALLLFGPLGLALAGGDAAAEIATDGTVGPRLELEGPEFGIGEELGTRAGDNLFHSFERFSLRTGESATFSGRETTRNVISRVTGGARSEIDGTIASTMPGADFYFINPAGVLFGPNAALNVPGSFHVSTADELRFDGGEVFSAIDPAASSFSLAAPEAFGFLGGAAGEIRVAGSQLALQNPGQTLSLSGGELVVENGSAMLANNIVLATQASAGSVPLAATGPAAPRTGTITLGSEASGEPASILSAGLFGGTLRMETGDLRIANAVVGDTHFSPVDSTGGIDVAAERVTIRNDNAAQGTSNGLLTFSLGGARAGDIRVAASELTLINGLIASIPTAGDGGAVVIEADRIRLAGNLPTVGGFGAPSGLFVAGGASGGVTVTAHESMTMESGGEINAASVGDQQGGSVAINLDRGATLTMQPGSQILAAALGTGAGGGIAITGGDVLVTGGVISAETFAGGNGGTIDIDTGRLLLDNSFLGANSRETASGNAGPVMVEADRIEIRNEGRIFNGTNSPFGGTGGDVTVTAGTLLIDGALDHEARFNTGISAGAQLGSTGRSGDVTVRVDDSIQLRNSGEIASATQGQGAAGDVVVSARSISLQDGGRFDSSSFGPSGDAGSLSITARNQLVLDRGLITTSAEQAGGGQITLQVNRLIDLQKSSIVSSVGQESGNAGDITIDPDFLVLDDSRILAQAVAGSGGDISIVADNLLISPDSIINAEAGDEGVDGTVVTSEPAVDLASALVVLDAPLLDAEALLLEPCALRDDVGASSFIGVGRGGLPASPDQPLGSAYMPPADTAVRPAAASTLALPCSSPF